MLNHYLYPSKVWLTSCLLGGTLFHIYNMISTWNYRSDYMEGGGLFFYFLTLGFTLFLSIPCLIVFVIAYDILSNTKLNNRLIKLVLSIICLVGCSVWFYMLFDIASQPPISAALSVVIPYSACLFGSVLYFKTSFRRNE